MTIDTNPQASVLGRVLIYKEYYLDLGSHTNLQESVLGHTQSTSEWIGLGTNLQASGLGQVLIYK